MKNVVYVNSLFITSSLGKLHIKINSENINVTYGKTIKKSPWPSFLYTAFPRGFTRAASRIKLPQFRSSLTSFISLECCPKIANANNPSSSSTNLNSLAQCSATAGPWRVRYSGPYFSRLNTLEYTIGVARIFDWGGGQLQITCNDVIRNFRKRNFLWGKDIVEWKI